jgi:hypothetical protein
MWIHNTERTGQRPFKTTLQGNNKTSFQSKQAKIAQRINFDNEIKEKIIIIVIKITLLATIRK